MTNIIEDTIKYIIQTQNAQFWGIVLLTICMILNAIISLPPSEIVITIVGGLLFRGGYFPFTVILFCIVFSNLIGACILYIVFNRFHDRIIRMKAWTRFPFFFNHILHSPLWDFVMQLFKKYGEKTVFICRMCPGIRSMITIPAKKSNMKLLKFVVYSFFGMLIWGLTWLLLSVWVFDDSVTEQLILKLCSAIAVIIALIIGVNYFIYRKAQKDKTSSK